MHTSNKECQPQVLAMIYTQPIIVTLVLTLPTSYSSSTTG